MLEIPADFLLIDIITNVKAQQQVKIVSLQLPTIKEKAVKCFQGTIKKQTFLM